MFDLTTLFIKIFNLSINATWIVLFVLLLRLILKKAPKWVSCLWWLLVGIRLVFPFSVESIFSLIPSGEVVSPDIIYSASPSISTGIPALNTIVNPVISSTFTPDPSNSVNPLQVVAIIGSWVWLFGIVAMLIYAAVCYILLKRKMRTAVKLEGNIKESENVTSPFILGIIKPKIYLPFSLDENSRNYIIAHEKAHIKRKDHIIKPIAFLILSVYWFNPLMWLSYVILCRDIELACDEKAVKDLEKEERREYSLALLNNSSHRRMIAACPLAFGEVGVKQRIKSVMSYKKPAFWVILVALIMSVVASVCLLTDPVKDHKLTPGFYKEGEIVYSERATSYITQNVYEVSEDGRLSVYDGAITADIGLLQKIDFGKMFSLTYNGKDPVLDKIDHIFVTKNWDAETEKDTCTLYYITETDVGGYYLIIATAPTKWVDAAMKGEKIETSGEITVKSIRRLTFEGKDYEGDKVVVDGRTNLTKEEKRNLAIREALKLNTPVYFGRQPEFTTESFEILAIKEEFKETDPNTNLLVGETVAIFYHRNSYDYKNSQLIESVSANTAIISFELTEDDGYILKEFSEKKKDDHDSAYAKTFHLMVDESKHDFEKTGITLALKCRKEALAYFGVADWVYSPMMSATFHNACPIMFSLDYDYAELSCSDGTMINEHFKKCLDAYKKGETPIWCPTRLGENENPKAVKSAEITFNLYKDGSVIHEGKITATAQKELQNELGTVYLFELTESDGSLMIDDGEMGPVIRLGNMYSESDVEIGSVVSLHDEKGKTIYEMGPVVHLSNRSYEALYYNKTTAETEPYKKTVANVFLQSDNIERLIKIVEEAKWNNVDLKNRTQLYFDGEFRLSDEDTFYFCEETNSIFFAPYLAEISEDDMRFIMSLQVRKIYKTENPDGTFASVTLYPGENFFDFTIHISNSDLCYGEYEETKDKIVLKDDNREFTYTFKKSMGELVFDEKNSSPIPDFDGKVMIVNGTEFTQ